MSRCPRRNRTGFGLIVANKSSAGNVIKRPSVFDEDSNSDGGPEKPTGLKTAPKRQDRVVQEKAVSEDPTVYQYDEIYDAMDQKRKESKLSRKDLDKKPKYINKLLEAANRRKQENERRIERQVQKEREAEGDEFKDKDAFVTNAYRKKLEEMKKLEEEEKREAYLESIGDVTKQGNLDGFYRHLYDQKVNFTDKSMLVEKEKDKAMVEKSPVVEGECDSDGNYKSCNDETPVKNRKLSVGKKRKYRKRDDSNCEDKDGGSDEGGAALRMEHLPSNLDADSDFSIDSDTDESEGEGKSKKAKKEEENLVAGAEKAGESKRGGGDGVKKEGEVPVKVAVGEEDAVKGEDDEKAKKEKEAAVKERKPKIDIWKKRTIGAAFDEALQRYYERKALRGAGN